MRGLLLGYSMALGALMLLTPGGSVWKQLESGGPSADRGRDLIREHGGVREALMATHPDHGGDPVDFADVQAARA
jgi:hypothetical protein